VLALEGAELGELGVQAGVILQSLLPALLQLLQLPERVVGLGPGLVGLVPRQPLGLLRFDHRLLLPAANLPALSLPLRSQPVPLPLGLRGRGLLRFQGGPQARAVSLLAAGLLHLRSQLVPLLLGLRGRSLLGFEGSPQARAVSLLAAGLLHLCSQPLHLRS